MERSRRESLPLTVGRPSVWVMSGHSLPVHVECLLTELKHISLGWLKNFYWFPVGLKSRNILWSRLSLPSEPFSRVHELVCICLQSVLLVNMFYLLSHFKEKHIEHSSFCETKCKGQRVRWHASRVPLAFPLMQVRGQLLFLIWLEVPTMWTTERIPEGDGCVPNSKAVSL